MANSNKIVTTKDGSSTIYVPELDEHYHSINGAVQESNHIFIEAGLRHHQSPNPHVVEIGFGTGLNAFLTAVEAEKESRPIRFTTLEKYPVQSELLDSLNYVAKDDPNYPLFERMHAVQWESMEPIHQHFSIKKVQTDFTEYDFQQDNDPFDLVYFDAFAPEKQPKLWEQSIFQKLYDAMNPGGILVTYCAKGVVRRSMQAVGFTVERIPGPPGKRQMIRATK